MTCVEGAAPALRLIDEALPFDVILCDLMMPTATGKTFYEQLLTRSPDTAARVVFLTGGAMTNELAAFLKAVPNRVVPKPFDVEQLDELVRGMLAEAAPARPG